MLDDLRQILVTDDEPPPIGDFGFHHDKSVVYEVAEMFRNHGILPGSGGWLDQEVTWTEDIGTYLRIRRRLEYELKADKYMDNWIEQLGKGASGARGFADMFRDS